MALLTATLSLFTAGCTGLRLQAAADLHALPQCQEITYQIQKSVDQNDKCDLVYLGGGKGAQVDVSNKKVMLPKYLSEANRDADPNYEVSRITIGSGEELSWDVFTGRFPDGLPVELVSGSSTVTYQLIAMPDEDHVLDLSNFTPEQLDSDLATSPEASLNADRFKVNDEVRLIAYGLAESGAFSSSYTRALREFHGQEGTVVKCFEPNSEGRAALVRLNNPVDLEFRKGLKGLLGRVKEVKTHVKMDSRHLRSPVGCFAGPSSETRLGDFVSGYVKPWVRTDRGRTICSLGVGLTAGGLFMGMCGLLNSAAA